MLRFNTVDKAMTKQISLIMWLTWVKKKKM